MNETPYTQGFRAGQINERDRIIKMLLNRAEIDKCDCGNDCAKWDSGFNTAIALIKGNENG
jgi:hypothetical protein